MPPKVSKSPNSDHDPQGKLRTHQISKDIFHCLDSSGNPKYWISRSKVWNNEWRAFTYEDRRFLRSSREFLPLLNFLQKNPVF